MNALAHRRLAEAFRQHERLIWGLCYRMTGCAADADDLVQDTFQRAMERPPRDQERPLRPWLVRVAMNLSRDRLRRRRRGRYVGPWLPSPVEPPAYEVRDETISTEGRYDLMESVSFAFLLALEQLPPQKRAVLILRDVFDYSVRETADALDMTEANVKTTLHRARRQMSAYDRESRCSGEVTARTETVLRQLVAGLAAGDVGALERLLTEDARALSDGGGEFITAYNPIVGPEKIARFFLGLARKRGAPSKVEIRPLSGSPAMVAVFAGGHPREATRIVLRVDLAADGRIRELHTVLASRKLTAVRFDT